MKIFFYITVQISKITETVTLSDKLHFH